MASMGNCEHGLLSFVFDAQHQFGWIMFKWLMLYGCYKYILSDSVSL
jgi:hypothetical protein